MKSLSPLIATTLSVVVVMEYVVGFSDAFTTTALQQPLCSYQRSNVREPRHRYSGCCSSPGTPVATSFLTATNNNDDGDKSESSSADDTPESQTTQSISHPWRVVMDIGREPLARMPFGWARQGVRMPLVVPTDFVSGNSVRPRSETVSFTGPEGAQESPILGNQWMLSEDGAFFSCSYTITKELRKRDVVIEAGTELFLSTKIYTQTELDRLNQEFYKAREAMWSTGGDLNDANNRQYSKKWNPQTERWEQRYPNENPFTMVKNQVSYWVQNAKQEKARNQRPEPESLSDRGGKLPGVGKDDEYVYLIQYGVVRYGGKDGPVCGLWTGQPITNVPAWERS